MKLLRTSLRWLFNLIAVPILLFEAWGLKPLLQLFQWLSRWRVWAWVEGRIAALPPYGALSLFVLPSLMLIPVKIAALYLLAANQKLLGLAVLVLAKVVGTVIVARIFLLTKPQLLRIPWFARAHARFIGWRDLVMARLRRTSIWRLSARLKAATRGFLRRLVARSRRWFKHPEAAADTSPENRTAGPD